MEHREPPGWITSNYRNREVYSILVAFLNEASKDPTRLPQLAEYTVTKLYASLTYDLDAEQYKLESRILYGILLTIVKDLDHASTRQDHLVKLVTTIRNTPLPQSVAESIDECDPYSEINQALTTFITVFSDFEHDAPLHPPLEDRSSTSTKPTTRPPWRQSLGNFLTAIQWTNLNAFVAKLHAALPEVPKLDLRGLFAMIEALEQPLTPTSLEDALPAATVWIVYAGDALKASNTPYPNYPAHGSMRLPWSKGELWTGQHAFNPARWEFWMRRFREIAEMDGVSETVKSMALKAVEVGSGVNAYES